VDAVPADGRGLEWGDLCGTFQPKPFCDPVNSVGSRVWALITLSFFEAIVTSSERRTVLSLTAVVSLFK